MYYMRASNNNMTMQRNVLMMTTKNRSEYSLTKLFLFFYYRFVFSEGRANKFSTLQLSFRVPNELDSFIVHFAR